MTITFRQFLDNVTGKGSAYLSKRSTIKSGLNLTFIKLLRETRRIFWAIPYVKDNGNILYWVKVPSELYKINKISYDVLIEFQYDPKHKRSLQNVKFFSNCPSFIFTYAYVFTKNNLVVPEFISRLPKESTTVEPVVRNPIESLGWEKSLYCAARYLLDGFCLSDFYIKKYGRKYDGNAEREIRSRIADPETLVAVYKHALYLQRKSHRKPLTRTEIMRRDAKNKKFVQKSKEIRKYEKRGMIFANTPRAKITARKATRSLLNPGSSKTNKVIRPNKKITPRH